MKRLLLTLTVIVSTTFPDPIVIETCRTAVEKSLQDTDDDHDEVVSIAFELIPK